MIQSSLFPGASPGPDAPPQRSPARASLDATLPGRRALLLGLGPLLAGCRSRGAARPQGVQRVVSLSPSTTETLYALGAGPSLVGRSRYCDYPPEVAALPQVGGYTDPNFEAILALRPDLVTGARGPAGPALSQRLDARGIETFFPPTESVAEIEGMIAGLGQRVGKAPEAAARIEAMHAQKARIAEQLAGKPRPRVLLLFGVTPIVAAGPGSFPDEMLRLAGALNTLDGSRSVVTAPYPTLALEQVIALDPDLLLDAAVMERSHRESLGPAWSTVRAVREGRVVTLSDEAVLRPGPRVIDGVATLARALHPGVSL